MSIADYQLVETKYQANIKVSHLNVEVTSNSINLWLLMVFYLTIKIVNDRYDTYRNFYNISLKNWVGTCKIIKICSFLIISQI